MAGEIRPLLLMTYIILLLALINPIQSIEYDFSMHLAGAYKHEGGKELDKKQFKKFVLEPTLAKLGLTNDRASTLLLMILAHESKKGHYLVQTTGQAKGVYQMEDATHDDIIKWLKAKKPALYEHIVRLGDGEPSAMKMVTDLDYATAMARAFFLRFPESLPATEEEMAAYAKFRWNTKAGKATAADYLSAYRSWK